jgi:rhamnosyltransferase
MKNKHSLPLPKIAILLAAYNGELWIQEQINSILNQVNVEIYLFISVDLSTDKTHELCKQYAQKYQNINILSYGERFNCAAKNFYRLILDVNFLDFDYVSLADQDDIWFPEKLSYAINSLKGNNVEAYSSNVSAFWESGKRKLVKKSYPQKKFDHYFESAGPGCTYVLKRNSAQFLKIFIKSNWVNVKKIESHDWLIYAFFRSNQMPWYIDSKVFMLYRQHELNQVGSNFGFLAYLKRIKMIKSGWYPSEVKKISEIVKVNDYCTFDLGRWFLIKNFYQLRRRNRDVFILLLMMLTGFF